MHHTFTTQKQQHLVEEIHAKLAAAKVSGDQDALDKAALLGVLKVAGKRHDMKVELRTQLLEHYKEAGFEPKKASSEDIAQANNAHKYATAVVGDLLQDIKDVQLTVHLANNNKYSDENLKDLQKTYETKPHIPMSAASFPSHYTTSNGGVSSFLDRSHGRG